MRPCGLAERFQKQTRRKQNHLARHEKTLHPRLFQTVLARRRARARRDPLRTNPRQRNRRGSAPRKQWRDDLRVVRLPCGAAAPLSEERAALRAGIIGGDGLQLVESYGSERAPPSRGIGAAAPGGDTRPACPPLHKRQPPENPCAGREFPAIPDDRGRSSLPKKTALQRREKGARASRFPSRRISPSRRSV
jgi:hypothetical protein